MASPPAAPAFPPIPLSALVEVVPDAQTRGDTGLSILDVAYDSRAVATGALFCCVPGEVTDGHRFARAALDTGAAALVVERWLDLPATQVLVGSVRSAMGPMAARAFREPAEAMTMLGVTGTNGKTTTTYLVEAIARRGGVRAGMIGTTGARIDGEPLPIERTTPEAPDLHRLLARMRDGGVGLVAMEVSSHALTQHRVGGVVFDAAAFTNLSQDHLDFHGSMQDYFEAKASLFAPEVSRRGIVNVDDPWGRRLLDPPQIPMSTFAVEADADLCARDVVVSSAGLSFRADGLLVGSSLRGAFNVSNCLAAIALARAAGCSDDAIVSGIADVREVPGRVEPIEEGQDFLVVVDYAHTPDSILGVLQAMRPLATGRLIVVFGCGGDRDRAKRPLMGSAATSVADLTIVTSDNPRSEDPVAIIADIEPGAVQGGGAYIVEPDRRTAIALALADARPGDAVVVAGKGHEHYQEFDGRTVEFDDRVVLRDELRALGGRS
ncbi:MAG: UDP-N-acetylmuramoyl-L-alanyl-D-glutamate--2,6-diaminopimelate ligase [Actinomycetota bacterium]|nr:UDP-N-acetylmuramoyl-L-alanyl-D-glutamate--2,6-diaminopimelate ligase [Actinomycetota bacterium]MDH5224287.1 UDP-N-acetylmuramoyl-L-alanyl-D-glutamate--2,6-diaminopimelate ligase [Actinomycetota bacterium]MDH5313024.1 UDP-N-acetylmuramoyl-L-alanyl-D-glutamate--2,6-diaminopimelate ligase [Actinomycetota bacterium]